MSAGVAFKEEFQRLMRAMNDSLERESELQRQLRRTKESLISVALRLQVAIKISQEDELTISGLLNQAADSRTKELIANRQAVEAHEMILSLNLEINTLKRKLKMTSEGEKGGSNAFSTSNTSAANNEILNNMNELADLEVDTLMNSDMHIPVNPGTGGRPELATPFDRWKMQQFMFSPDTPAGSESHDRDVVNMLVAASTFELHDDYKKPTTSGIAKMKRVNSLAKIRSNANKRDGFDPRLGTPAGAGANNYEGVGDIGGDSYDPIAVLSSSGTGQDPQYFLSTGAPMWGAGTKFDHDNMGRNNLWTSSAHVSGTNRGTTATSSSTSSGGKTLRRTGSENLGSPTSPATVRLKSIRLPPATTPGTQQYGHTTGSNMHGDGNNRATSPNIRIRI